MNISEFERQLREAQAPGAFQPGDGAWRKLELELSQKRRGPAFPTMLRWSAAAVVLLLIGIGYYSHLPGTGPQGPPMSRKPAPETSSALPADPTFPETPLREQSPSISAGLIARSAREKPFQEQRELKRQSLLPAQPAGDTAALAAVPEPEPLTESVSTIGAPASQPSLPRFGAPDDGPLPAGRKLRFGISAQYGRSDISSGQYRLAVDARRDLSGRFFAAVQLNASAVALTTSTDYRYQSFAYSPGAGAVVGIQPATANYRGNVFSIGMSPSVGIRAGKTLSLSVGPDLQKRLTGRLNLSNEENFRNQVTKQLLIDVEQQVADFDFGLQSAAQLRVNPRLELSMMYRRGMSNYLSRNMSAVRNSYLAAGLSYRFNR